MSSIHPFEETLPSSVDNYDLCVYVCVYTYPNIHSRCKGTKIICTMQIFTQKKRKKVDFCA